MPWRMSIFTIRDATLVPVYDALFVDVIIEYQPALCVNLAHARVSLLKYMKETTVRC